MSDIKIKLQFTDNMALIFVNAKEYAVIDGVRPADSIDLDAIKHWVNETYNKADHDSTHYMPCYLRKRDFKKETI